MTAAKRNFDLHITQCVDAITIYSFLEGNGYNAEFGLRFVWVASVSALDHYITELIVEKSTENFANGTDLTAKLSGEGVPLKALLTIRSVSPLQAVVQFREIMKTVVRYQTFQKADDVSSGLAYIWNEKHKWNVISDSIGLSAKTARRKLNGICSRRDLIAHNADYNEATGELTPCTLADAEEVVDYISKVVAAIDSQVC